MDNTICSKNILVISLVTIFLEYHLINFKVENTENKKYKIL